MPHARCALRAPERIPTAAAAMIAAERCRFCTRAHAAAAICRLAPPRRYAIFAAADAAFDADALRYICAAIFAAACRRAFAFAAAAAEWSPRPAACRHRRLRPDTAVAPRLQLSPLAMPFHFSASLPPSRYLYAFYMRLLLFAAAGFRRLRLRRRLPPPLSRLMSRRASRRRADAAAPIISPADCRAAARRASL